MSKTSVLAYFNDLSSGAASLADLETYWPKLEGLELPAAVHSKILSVVASTIYAHKNSAERQRYESYIHDHFGIWGTSLPKTIAEGDSQAIIDVLSAYRRLRKRPAPHLLEQVDGHIDANLIECSLSGMAQYLRASASFTHIPNDHLLGRIIKIIHDVPDVMPLETYAMVYWSAAELEAIAGKNLPYSRQIHAAYQKAYPFYFEPLRADPANDRYMSQIRSAALWFTGKSMGIANLKTDDRTSRWERGLRNSFIDAGIKPVDDDRMNIVELDKRTDLTFEMGSRTVHLEADGESHFQLLEEGERAYTGEDIFNMRLVQKLRPQDNFIHLPRGDWAGILNSFGSNHAAVRNIAIAMRSSVTQADINKHGNTLVLRHSPAAGLATEPLHRHGTLSFTF